MAEEDVEDRQEARAGAPPVSDRPSPQRAVTPGASRVPMTDELVRQVADRVYAMLKQDIAGERERSRG